MKNVVPVTGHDFQSVTTMEGIKKGIEIEIEGKYASKRLRDKWLQ